MYFPKTELEELRKILNTLINESDAVSDMLLDRNIMTRDTFFELSTTYVQTLTSYFELSTTYVQTLTSYFDRIPSTENVVRVSQAISDASRLDMDDEDYLDAENPYNTKALTEDDMKDLIEEIENEVLVAQ